MTEDDDKYESQGRSPREERRDQDERGYRDARREEEDRYRLRGREDLQRAMDQAARNALALYVDKVHPIIGQDEIERIARTAAMAVVKEFEEKQLDIFDSIGMSLRPDKRRDTAEKLRRLFNMQDGVSMFVKILFGAIITGIGGAIALFFVKPWFGK